MPSLAVLRVLLRELTTRERAARVPEPFAIMDEPENVEAYLRAGTMSECWRRFIFTVRRRSAMLSAPEILYSIWGAARRPNSGSWRG